MFSLLKQQLIEVLKAVAPLVGIVCLLQVTIVGAPLVLFLHFLAGSALIVAGMLLLFMGIELGILPMGRFIGAELPKYGSLTVIVLVAFALGFATTVAEPDVVVLAEQVDAISQGGIPGMMVTYVIALGLAMFVAIAMARVVHGFPILHLLAFAYLTMIALSFLAPPEFIALAYDAGSVTTGVLSAPVIIALALGLSAVLAGRSPVSDGFGLLGFASIGPIIAVLVMGILLR